MKIFAHHDPDGLISAYFTKKAVGGDIVVVEEFGDTSKWQKGDYMVDMRPKDPKIEGQVIDHHPNHPTIVERKYNLIWDNVPASLICWRLYKDKIPKDEWWKVVIGVVGDGQANLIPAEVFESNKMLLQNLKTYSRLSYGDWKISYYPVYLLLSSPINAFARCGEYRTALNLIEKAKSPLDIIENKEAIAKKSEVAKACESAIDNARIYDFTNLKVVLFRSENIRLSGYVASKLAGQSNTVLAINEVNGHLSLRGDLSLYYKEKFKKLKYLELDGHPGFMGGRLKTDTSVFLNDLVELL